MMSIKKIDKIRYLYFDVGMPVRDIWRNTNISPTSIYKYIKMDDFSPKPTKPRTKQPSVFIMVPIKTIDKLKRMYFD